MRRSVALIAFAISLFALCGAGSAFLWLRAARKGPADPAPALRVVSLAPSVTEILFSIGAGGRLVGVTDFCAYPSEARAIPHVGGLLDPNFEALLDLAPDLAIILSAHAESAPVLAALGIPILTVDHASIAGILDSITSIGRACGADDRARSLVADLRARLNKVVELARGLPRVRTLLCIDRQLGSLRELCIVGKDGLYDPLLTMAGGSNVYEPPTPLFPSIGAESVIALDPQVIIELRVVTAAAGEDDAAVLADWGTLGAVAAVRAGRIHVFRDAYLVIPGPRIATIAERLLATLHPECSGELR